jgi:hypothetical protein
MYCATLFFLERKVPYSDVAKWEAAWKQQILFRTVNKKTNNKKQMYLCISFIRYLILLFFMKKKLYVWYTIVY